jgi:hypothetical protein
MGRIGIEPTGKYSFFYEKGNKIMNYVQVSLYIKEVVSDRMSYIILTGR